MGAGKTMSADLIESLPLAHRLALSYAPRQTRDATLALLALDARLAGIVRTDGEAIIAQMKLAWWRERLEQPPASWPEGEPLLALMRESLPNPRNLVPLVDGWECLLSEQLDRDAITTFAAGRTVGWQQVSQGTDPVLQAREWALVDLALNLGQQEEREAALELARAQPWQPVRLPRELRPLAVLHGLARRALGRAGSEMLDGPGAMFTVMRLGFLGR